MLDPLPSRSVARFLLPLADIMALLFSFFLLMPHLEQQPGQALAEGERARSIWSQAEDERRAREELERHRRQRQLPVEQRLLIVVLDVDGDTGDLMLQEASGAKRLTQENVDAFITSHLEAARASERELFYLLRVARPDERGTRVHPTLADERRYRAWFGKHKVQYRLDYPRLTQ